MRWSFLLERMFSMSDSKYSDQSKQSQETGKINQNKNVRGDTMVDEIVFKSKEPKEGQTFYVSKIHKPAPLKDNPNFFQLLMFKFLRDSTTGIAAQLAYYFMLALFPLLIFLLTLVPLFNIETSTILEFIEDYAPEQIAGLLSGIITDVMEGAGGGVLSLGLLLTLWSASNGMNALMNAFNVAYNVEDNRNIIVVRTYSVIFTLILTLSILLTFTLIVFGGQIGNLMFGVIGLDSEFTTVWNLIRSLLPFILVFIVFLVMYTFAPNVKNRMKSTLAGTAFTTVAFLITSWGFSIYVTNFGNYNATYGSLAGVIILMFWLFLTGVIIIVGAQINSIIYERQIEREEKEQKKGQDDEDAPTTRITRVQ